MHSRYAYRQILINIGLQICEICAAEKKQQAWKYCHVGIRQSYLMNSDIPSLLVTTELRLKQRHRVMTLTVSNVSWSSEIV